MKHFIFVLMWSELCLCSHGNTKSLKHTQMITDNSNFRDLQGALACKSSRAGLDYMSTEHHTWSGKFCQPWKSQHPHTHTVGTTDDEFPDRNISLVHNFCRNPDNDSLGPWCFTMDINKIAEHCLIHLCSEKTAVEIYPECKDNGYGMDYKGKISITKMGHKCMLWTLTNYVYFPYFPDDSLDDALNYCRNPGGVYSGPWCMIANSPTQQWGYCKINRCNTSHIETYDKCKLNRRGMSYQGKVNHTTYDEPCIPWTMTKYNSDNFPDDSVQDASNFCRNPIADSLGPWCYFMVDEVRMWDYCAIHMCSEPLPGIHAECKHDRRGLDYQGKINITWTGQACSHWIHIRGYINLDNLPDDTVDEAFNYCRNTDNSSLGPFCMIQNHEGFTKESCLIHMCSEPKPGTYLECKQNPLGINYRGNISHTIVGKKCIPWFLTKYDKSSDKFPDKNVDEAFNYCRNPIGISKLGPWCYNQAAGNLHEPSTCGIPICGITQELNKLYINHTRPTYYRTIFYDVADGIQMSIFPVVIICGTIMNIFSICVFTSPSMRKSTTAYILVILAVADTISLYIGALEEFLVTVTGTFLKATTDLSCQIYSYIWCIVRGSSPWVLVVVTLDRVINLAKPYQASSISNVKNVKYVLLSIFICICVCYAPVLMYIVSYFDSVFDNNNANARLVLYANCAAVFLPSFKKFDMSIHCILPFILMCIGNTSIIILFYHTIKHRRSMKQTDHDNSDQNRLLSLTTLLLTTSCIYLVLTLPYVIYMGCSGYLSSGSERLFYTCAFCFEYINNSINFLLYCITSKQFRDIFMTMITGIKCVCWSIPNIISPVKPDAEKIELDEERHKNSIEQKFTIQYMTQNQIINVFSEDSTQKSMELVSQPSTSFLTNSKKQEISNIDIT